MENQLCFLCVNPVPYNIITIPPVPEYLSVYSLKIVRDVTSRDPMI